MRRVLIVEDDPRISTALAKRLDGAGYQVHLARDAVEGTADAIKLLPDAIVLDVAMPCGGGISLLERLASISSTATIPVIVFTGRHDEHLRDHVRQLGATALFDIPFDPDRLMAALDEAVLTRAVHAD